MHAREGNAARQALQGPLKRLAELGGSPRLAATGLLLESFCLLVGAAV